jgi:hypothetical protein
MSEIAPHPEDVCQQCGGPNIVWFAPNEIWNRVMLDGGILCPICFVQRAETEGIKEIWRLAPAEPKTTSVPDDRIEAVAKMAWGAWMEDSTSEIDWYDADDEVREIWRDAARRIVAFVEETKR